MIRAVSCLLAASILATAAQASDRIDTMERGRYVCELPDTTARTTGIEQPRQSFRILSGSRYRTVDGTGTYLRRGDKMTMTSGPHNGYEFKVISETFVRKIENGKPGRLRCVRVER